jgi:hypothetical protein
MGLYCNNAFCCSAERRHGASRFNIHDNGDDMTDNYVFDIDQLRADNHTIPLSEPHRKVPRHKTGQFLKGPIPLDWLTAAASQPGKALHVGLGIWFWAGMKKSPQVAFSMLWLKTTFGVDRWSGYRGLAALEKVGLVSVFQQRGRKSLVTLLDAPAAIPPAIEGESLGGD